jgi:PAS domain S-box-containing protein
MRQDSVNRRVKQLRRMTADLEAERNLLQAIMENTRAHLAYLDQEFNFVMVNSIYARGCGYSREELIGRNHFALFPNPENQAIFEQVRDTGEQAMFHAKPFEFPDRPDLGTTYWDWTLTPARDEKGETQGLVLSLIDVTEQVQAQAEIESLSRFPRENPHPVLRVAADGTILYANPGSAPLLAQWGVQVGQKVTDEWRQRVTGTLNTGDGQVLEVPCDERTFSLTISPIAEMGYANLYGLDVTARKAAQEVLHQYTDRLRVLHEIDQAILAARSIEEVGESALSQVSRLLGCVRASIVLYDLEQGEMRFLAVHTDGETELGKGWYGAIDFIWTEAMEELAKGRFYTIEDVQNASLSSPVVEMLQTEGVRAYVILPLIIEGGLVGSLNFGMRTPGYLMPDQMEIAQELAVQLAIGIHQARLNEHVRQHADELEALVARRTRALRDREARLRAIFEGSGIGIAVLDMDGRVEESNPALQELLGCSAKELRGKLLTDFSHPDDVIADETFYKELMAQKKGVGRYRAERCYVRRDGRLCWASVTASLVRVHRRKPQFVIVMMEDITERRRAQEALIQSEKLAITGQLAASLAHEINNPMQSVIGCLGLAQESLEAGDEEDVRELLQIAAEELDRAAKTVADLRDLNQPSSPEDREPADVNLQLEHVLMLTRKQCQERGVEVEWRPAEDLPALKLVPDRMQQVFLNLLLNALDAMPDGGRLRVSTGCTGEQAQVWIAFADTGRGIAPDALPHVFDPFYTTKSEGLGLGLYITRNIVEEHGGRIEVESLLGEGTTFTVWLPAPEDGDGGES